VGPRLEWLLSRGRGDCERDQAMSRARTDHRHAMFSFTLLIISLLMYRGEGSWIVSSLYAK
jgi:hypothetical protein